MIMRVHAPSKGVATSQFSFWLSCGNVGPLFPEVQVFKRETGNFNFYVNSLNYKH